eukprot:TRINITY_DN22329_c0_g1_i1.p1 TRINITY_DN22329_c0_g1~~TRINITY_DN22329_c0_g1_i1.p1  ORF type:complete len:168 (-),score=25.62 TRINITY_DN22329_c0_g1_i1:43-546(-)
MSDCRAVVDYIRGRLGVLADSILLVGRSIGTGPALQLAAEDPAYCGVVTISAYKSVREVIRHTAGNLAAGFFPDQFVNIERVNELQCPAIFLHGAEDAVIPCYHSEDLYYACPSEWRDLIIVEGMDHNNVFSEEFLEEYFLQPLRVLLSSVDLRRISIDLVTVWPQG